MLPKSPTEISQASARDGLICAVGSYPFVERLHARSLEDLGALPLSRVSRGGQRLCALPCSSGIAVGHADLGGQRQALSEAPPKRPAAEVAARDIAAATYAVSESSIPRFATLFGATSGRVRGCALPPKVVRREANGNIHWMDYVPPESVASGDGFCGAFLCGTNCLLFDRVGSAKYGWVSLWSAETDVAAADGCADESPVRLLATYGNGQGDSLGNAKVGRFVKEWNSFILGSHSHSWAVARYDLTREDGPVMTCGSSDRSVRAIDADAVAKVIFSVNFNKTARMYDYDQKKVVAITKLQSEGISGVYDESRHLLLAGATYGKIEFFDSRKFSQRLGVVKAHSCGSVTGVNIVSAKDGIYTSCNAMRPYSVSLWNVKRKVLHRFDTVSTNRDVCCAQCDSGYDEKRLFEEAAERCSFVVGFEFFGGAKLLCQTISREVFLFKSLLV